jgi:ribose transport system substrate-binding protein
MSRSKSLLVLLSLALVIVLLAACAPPPAPAPEAPKPAATEAAPQPAATEAPKEAPKAEQKLKIAYIRPTNEPYYKYGFDGAQMMADKMGVDLLGYISDMKPERELASIEDAITQKVDGIVLMSVSATSFVSSINKAHEAGIPVYMLFGYNKDLMDKMVGTVQADCNLSGAIIGEWVAKNIPEGEVAVIMGQPGRGDAECYRDSFKAKMEANPKLKLVAAVPGDWNRQKAFDQMQNLITSNPNLKAVFVQNEDMALGAIQALKQAGKEKDVAIVSQNGAPYGLESIAADGIKATVGWSPAQEAQLALRQLVESVNGTKQPWQLTISPMTVITKDNVGEATPWEPTDASTQATLDLDLTQLKHEFAEAAPGEAPKEAAEAGKKLKIAYIRPTNEPYYKYGFDGAQMMADKMGVDLLGYISDMKPERELASIEDAITQKVDGIVLMSVSATSFVSSINKAHEAGIPVYMLFGYNKDLMDKMVGTVQADCNLSGAIIGEWVAKNIPEGEVAVIMGQPGRGDAECYRDSFKAKMEANPKLKLVAAVPGDWNRQKAFDQMQNLITSNPNLKAVFVQNEDMALGAIQALKQGGAEKDVVIVSQNGAPYGLESIAADGIKATVGWSPAQEAQLALRQLVESINGTKQPWQLTISPMTVITKDNVGEATPWEPTDASTQATLDLDLSKLKHEFAESAGY